MIKQAQKIEVGMHEGRPGFTIEYTDGERAHFVFNRSIAKSLGDGLHKIVADLEYMERQMSGGAPGTGVSINDACQVRLSKPNEGSLGIGSGDGVNVD